MGRVWVVLVLVLFFLVFSIPKVLAGDLNISTVEEFEDLDGSGSDDDGLNNSVLSIDGNLTILSNGSIECNDDLPIPAASGACPIIINVTGNLLIEANGSILAENQITSGSGGNITIFVGGNLTLKGSSGNLPGAIISSSKTTGGGTGGISGNMTINVSGNIAMEPNSTIAANSENSQAGTIKIFANGTMELDGFILSGPDRDIQAYPGRLTGRVLQGGGTGQRGGPITIISNSTICPAINISKEGIIATEGEDPGADAILIESCGIDVNGIISAIGKRQKAEVILRSGKNIIVNSQDLGNFNGLNQGRVRADNLQDGADKSKVNMFATNEIAVNGPLNGSIFSVTSVPGNANSRPAGGFIHVISLNSTINASGLSFLVGKNNAGNSGGNITLEGKNDITLDDSNLQAIGDFSASGGFGRGGNISIRSYSGGINWQNGTGDVRPTGDDTISPFNDDPPVANRGNVFLQKCTFLNINGTVFPFNGDTPTTPIIFGDLCSPSEPSLPSGVNPLPICLLQVQENPNGTIIVVKQVLSAGGIPVNDSTPFNVTINGTTKIIAKNVQNATYSLPQGNYTITEQSNPLYILVSFSNDNDGNPNNGASFNLTNGENLAIIVTNQLKPQVQVPSLSPEVLILLLLLIGGIGFWKMKN